jgi:AcrR family transcriptional regulator
LTSRGCLTGYRIVVMEEANVRPLRADAARNRARVLDAARSAFAEAGLDVGVEEIARRAGVGKGTLYRRFPTKEALVRAIFEDILDEIEHIVEAAEAEPDAWTAFTAYLSATARMQASNQGFYDVVAQRLGAAALTDDQRERIIDTTTRMLKRAQEARVVRDDLVPEDVQLMLRMVGATTRPAPDGTPMDDHWPRYLGLLLDAVRPESATPLQAEPWRLKRSS